MLIYEGIYHHLAKGGVKWSGELHKPRRICQVDLHDTFLMGAL